MDKLIRNSTAEFLIFTSVWLTQNMIAELFDKGRTTITEHLKNIFENHELEENAVCREFRATEILVSSKMEPTCKNSLQVQKENAK